MSTHTPATRIFGIVAREAPRVVLVRRGPTKHVLLITWDTLKHEFRAGQWLKGRIYEERCDLSPSGEKFIYLAANHKSPLGSWTAVSRPPFLTALVLWDNLGTWGGGGLFDDERGIALNKRGGLTPETGFQLPEDVKVRPIASWAGQGEDDPIRSRRMKRDGWVLADEGKCGEYQHNAPRRRYHWEYSRPEVWQHRRDELTLERRLLGVGEVGGPWRATEHRIIDSHGNILIDLGRSDWADWSDRGELLFTRDGRAGRVAFDRKGAPREPEALIDLRALRFEELPPPPEATTWHLKVTGRKIT